MATFNVTWENGNVTGTTGYRVYYRPSGTSLWVTQITSGLTMTIGGLVNNYIYDIQVQNLSTSQGNPITTIMQGIGITDPLPVLSPTNTSIGFSFNNLSSYMTSYTASVALAATPGTAVETLHFSPTSVVTGLFTNLTNLTNYIVTIQPVASQFTATFTYPVITLEQASCADPVNTHATLTSGTPVVNIYWRSPAILPSVGYLINYKRKGDTSFNSLLTSGLTSGNVYVLDIPAIANYQGYIQSNCGGGNLSVGAPFGINATDIPSVSIGIQVSPIAYIATVRSLYTNPYSTLMSGTFFSTIAGLVPFTLTYPAGVTSAVLTLSTSPMSLNEVISNPVFNAIAPNFDNGGSLQQFDSVLTPSYYQFITSGTVWNGNPAKLSSFTLDAFTVTQIDVSNNVQAGVLNFSWIYDSVYLAGAVPYNTVTFQMRDPSNSAVMGQLVTATGTLGIQAFSMSLNLQVTAITPTNSFNLVALWANGTIINTIPFYLPAFIP